jgi:hypothetical protein
VDSPQVEADKEADPLQHDIDPKRLSTSRGHVPGPRPGAGKGRARAPAKPASQPMPALTMEVVGTDRPRRRACTQEETKQKK